MSNVLKVNGVEKDFPDGEVPATIAELLERLEIDRATVVAEIDGQIVQRKDFAATSVGPGQVIELVRFVGGG